MLGDTLSVEVCQVSESGSKQLQSASSSVTPKPTEAVQNSAKSVVKNEEDTIKDQAEQGTQSPQKKRTRYVDTEEIIMGEELSDLEINFA